MSDKRILEFETATEAGDADFVVIDSLAGGTRKIPVTDLPGGGGTTVVPNPVGEPTDELETVRIGDTIFSIPGSGGGAGSSFTSEIIAQYSDYTQNIVFDNPVTDYDMVLFQGYFDDGYGNHGTINTIFTSEQLIDNITDSDAICGLCNDSYYVYFKMLTSTTATGGPRNKMYIRNVYGIKFGGSGNGYDSTLLWDYVDDNNGTIPYGIYTETLHDDINNYNVIILEFASARTDLTNVDWDSTVFVTLDVEALNNAWNPNKSNITTFGERSSRFYIHDNVLQKTIDNQGDTNGLVRVYGVKFGGGSGSGGGYSETDLFVNTGSSNPSSIVMNDSIQNYDEIVFKTTRNAYGNTYKLQYRYLTSELELGDQIQCWCWGPNNEYFSYVLTAFDTFSNMAQGNALLCTKIIGIKY